MMCMCNRDVGNVVNVRFKDEIRENKHVTDHVQVAHDQKCCT